MWLIKGKLIANNNKRRSADTLRTVPGAFGISFANIRNNLKKDLEELLFYVDGTVAVSCHNNCKSRRIRLLPPDVIKCCIDIIF